MRNQLTFMLRRSLNHLRLPLPRLLPLPLSKTTHHTSKVAHLDNETVVRSLTRNQQNAVVQYVRIRLAIGTEPDALMVPEAALGSSQLGKYVYVVGEGNKVDQRLVSLGPSDGGLVVVLKGVSDGDRVINGNLQKIGPGALVEPLLQ